MTETTDHGQEGTEVKETQEAGKEQSETTTEEGKEASETYNIKFPDGTDKDMSATELYEHYQTIGPNFNKISQELAGFKKAETERETRAESKAQEALDKSDLLEDVDPNVKAAIGKIALDTLKTYIKENDVETARKEKDREWDSRLSDAEKAHDGKDGLPGFARDDILAFMIEKEIYDPEVAYSELHKSVIADKMIKEAIKGKGSDSDTESTGGASPKKPIAKQAKSFDEAAKNAYARMNKK